jgi:hypothetical protein
MNATGRRKAPLAALLVVALLLLAWAPVATAQETGSIVGNVTNGTAGGPVPADLEVVVHVLQNRVKTGEQRVRTDGSGSFRVDGLATGAEYLYFPITEYGGVPYYPDTPISLTSAQPASTEITVFEATPTPDAVSFDRLNMLVMGVSPTALSIMQMGAVINAGDTTFAADAEVTGSGRTLQFTLPTGAMDVTPQAGLAPDALESTPDGFAATDPVRPGRREIAFSYQLPYTASTLDLSQSFALPVGAFTLYAPPEIGEVVGPGMAFQGTADLGGRQFRQYVVEGIKPGAEIRFRLTGLPAPLFARPRDLGMAVAGVAGMILLGFLGLAVQRRAAAGPEPVATTDVPTERVVPKSTAERAELVRAVAELDERYAQGSLDEAEYQAARTEQKARLVELTRATAPAS